MSNTGITLVDVRQEAMDAIRKLKSGDISVPLKWDELNN